MESMQALIDQLALPLAGCVFAAALQHQALFMKQTEESFELPFIAKGRAFENLTNVIRIQDLDFFIAISSIAGFGVAGETNYSRYDLSKRIHEYCLMPSQR